MLLTSTFTEELCAGCLLICIQRRRFCAAWNMIPCSADMLASVQLFFASRNCSIVQQIATAFLFSLSRCSRRPIDGTGNSVPIILSLLGMAGMHLTIYCMCTITDVSPLPPYTREFKSSYVPQITVAKMTNSDEDLLQPKELNTIAVAC